MRELNLFDWSRILSSMPRTLAEWANQQNDSFESWEISGQLTGASYFPCTDLACTRSAWPNARSHALRRVTPWDPDAPRARSALELGSVSRTCSGGGHLVEVISQRTLNTILQEAGKMERKRKRCAKWGRAVHYEKYLGSARSVREAPRCEIREVFTELGPVENNFPGQPIIDLFISTFCFSFIFIGNILLFGHISEKYFPSPSYRSSDWLSLPWPFLGLYLIGKTLSSWELVQGGSWKPGGGWFGQAIPQVTWPPGELPTGLDPTSS